MDNIGICCNCCGRTTQGATYVNGMYFCAKCYQDTFGSKIVNVTINNKSIPEINKEVNVNDLEQQLVDKDRKINKLSEEYFELFGDMKDYKNLWLAEQRKNKEIRKQVCDEIRNLSAIDVINKIYIVDIEILDQIEKGEEV